MNIFGQKVLPNLRSFDFADDNRGVKFALDPDGKGRPIGNGLVAPNKLPASERKILSVCDRKSIHISG